MPIPSSSSPEQAGLFLYTHRLPDDIRGDVERIVAPGDMRKFRSGVFDAAGMQTWYHAQTKDGVSFQVVRYDGMAGGGVYTRNTVLRQACFFDALHYCARHDHAAGRDGISRPVIDLSGHPADGIPAWQVAARSAFQPLDLGGMPHPAVDGNILTDESFDADALELAARSKPVSTAAGGAGVQYSPFFDLAAQLGADGKSIPKRIDQAAENLHDAVVYKEVSRLLFSDSRYSSDEDAVSVCERLGRHDAVKNKLQFWRFRWSNIDKLPVFVIGGIFAAFGGLIGVAAAAGAFMFMSGAAAGAAVGGGSVALVELIKQKGDSWFRAATGMQDWLKKYKKLVRKMPEDSRGRTLCQEFAGVAESAFLLKNAQLYYKNKVDDIKVDHKKLLRDVFSMVDRAATVGRIAPDDVVRLKDAYLRNNLPPDTVYEVSLKERAKQLHHALAEECPKI